MANRQSRTKRASAPSAPWLDELLEGCVAVAKAAKKLDFYHDSRREPPEHLGQQLEASEKALQARVDALLHERPNLLDEIEADERFGEDALDEFDFCYEKAVCYGPGLTKAHSRLFLLPCVYWSGAAPDGSKDVGLVDFSGERGAIFAEYVSGFLKDKFDIEGDLEEPTVSVYPHTVAHWTVPMSEERGFPKLREATLQGAPLDLSEHFPTRAASVAKNVSEEGWSIAALPFVVEHGDEAWLESVDFRDFAEDFREGFEEIFDTSSKLGYDAPVDPTSMQDESVRMLWKNQMGLTIRKMSELKKPKHLGVVEAICVWENNDFVGVVMDCRVVDPESPARDDEEGEPTLWRIQIQRPALMGESPGALAGYLAERPDLRRADFELVVSHSFQ